jgi:hypothetical protein
MLLVKKRKALIPKGKVVYGLLGSSVEVSGTLD